MFIWYLEDEKMVFFIVLIALFIYIQDSISFGIRYVYIRWRREKFQALLREFESWAYKTNQLWSYYKCGRLELVISNMFGWSSTNSSIM